MITEKATPYRRPIGETTLVSYSLVLDTHRTSVRMERSTYAALRKVAERHGLNVHQYASRVAKTHNRGSFSSALRAKIIIDLADMAGIEL